MSDTNAGLMDQEAAIVCTMGKVDKFGGHAESIVALGTKSWEKKRYRPRYCTRIREGEGSWRSQQRG